MAHLTTKNVADLLGVSERRVRQLAEELNVGEQIGGGRRGMWLFQDADVDRMRERSTRPGRSAKGESGDEEDEATVSSQTEKQA